MKSKVIIIIAIIHRLTLKQTDNFLKNHLLQLLKVLLKILFNKKINFRIRIKIKNRQQIIKVLE
jgi:hypothetical protein